jgi:hypothetical protein
VPGGLENLEETITPRLEWQEMESSPMRGCRGSVQQERRMIRAERRNGLQPMRGEQEFPVHRDELSINSLKGWVLTLIAPSIEPPIQMDFLQRGLIEKAPKLPHLPPIKLIIALVFYFIDHVEVTC